MELLPTSSREPTGTPQGAHLWRVIKMNGLSDLVSVVLLMALVLVAPLLYDLATALNLTH